MTYCTLQPPQTSPQASLDCSNFELSIDLLTTTYNGSSKTSLLFLNFQYHFLIPTAHQPNEETDQPPTLLGNPVQLA